MTHVAQTPIPPTPLDASPSLSPAGEDDAEALSELAWNIWNRHYFPDILSLAEIRHLWQRGYQADVIRADIQRGTDYFWIISAQKPVGFVAWRSGEACLWLCKLYVLPELHGRGLGAYALSRAEHVARALGVAEIRLYVFKRNQQALRAYRRAGFAIAASEISDAGDGFVYDDYLMSKAIMGHNPPAG